jgi:1-acyl-sn-glycerol-3-phosphate acyltransferase
VRTPLLDFFRPGMHALARAYFRLELRGTENIPSEGAVIVTPNHQTYADPPLVTIPIKRPVYYMAWNRLFEIPLFGWWIRHLRAFPVQLESSDPRAVRAAVRLLAAKEALMIFPEAERTWDGSVQPFKLGAFRLAASLGVPVLPVTIMGAWEAWPREQMLPRRGRVTIMYHPLEHPDPTLPSRAAARELADRTHAVIAGALKG